MSKRKNLADELAKGPSGRREFGGGSLLDWGDYGKGQTKSYTRCYDTHPPLPLPGTDFVIYGGNCGHPVVTDADVYIGLDSGISRVTPRSWPWKQGTEFLFKIPDMGVPASADEFKKLVAWTRKQVDAGKKVHIGCIGGHGRTGMVLAAIVSTYGEADAITYVREKYCKKAVESTKQVDFLAEHFGVKKVQGTKSTGAYSSLSTIKGTKAQPKTRELHPLARVVTIWG